MTIESFLKTKYKNALTTKCRNRELVMQRRMLSLFLVNELRMKKIHASRILGFSHQAVSLFLKPVHDPQFNKFYESEKTNLISELENFCQKYNIEMYGKG